jgi:ATP-dependent exoDNAse (exonuclease V) beta subunit
MMQRHSFSIYDASAGSGKTYALVKEYLIIILTSPKNDAYRNILAITFTNKAVHEMKTRIVGSLSDFASDTPSSKSQDLMQDLSADTSLSIVQIKTKAQQIIKHLIHNYAAFDISTIDKFTHKVIRAFAHDLNLPMTFEVTLDTENLLIEAVDAIIAQAGEDEILTNLLVDFTMEKTDDDKSWDISREILETGKLVLNENNRNEINHLQDKSITDFLEIKKKLAIVCEDLKKETIVLGNEAAALIVQNGIDVRSFSRGTLPNHITSIQEGKFNPKNKMFREPDDIVINKTAHDRALIEVIIPDLLAILSQVYALFEKIHFYNAFLKNITPLSLLNTISNQLTKIQQEQNILSISEFNTLIHKEIQNQPAPFIYERLGERYRHFFIDEFQDTSEMQWGNLIPLIDNALSGQDEFGDKGTLMIVGDPKQSIYRWRGGKAEQFIELSKDQNPFNNPDKKLTQLEYNYRSYSQIIEFNNSFFKLLANEFQHPDYKDLYENHSHQKVNSKTGGYVNVSFLLDTPETEEEVLDKTGMYVKATLETINKVVEKGFEYKDIVILTRKRDQGIAIANYLTEQGVPLLSSETLMIQNATEVRFIIYLLKYLKNPSDIDAKAHFLHYLASHVQNILPVHEFIAKGKELVQETEFENWLSQFNLALSFQNLRKKPLYEAVEIMVTKFLAPALRASSYVQYFLDIVLESAIRNQSSVADFLDFWNKSGEKFSIPSPEGTNAVRIMTIHKSKGLEFPVVIFPFAEEDYSRKPKDKLWLNADEETVGLPKVLIDNNTTVESFGQDAATLYTIKKEEELLDNINVLYVALTRAEEQLYIISSKNRSSKGEIPKNNMCVFFINYLISQRVYDANKFEYEFGNSTKLSLKEKHKDTSKTIPIVTNVLNSKNIKIAQREALMWGSHQQEAIEYGNLTHEILSFVKTKNDVEWAINQALENGLIQLSKREVVRQTILEIVEHKALYHHFARDNQVLNEQTIIQKDGKIIKPDRMVITPEKKVYLLDYKTGSPNSKYSLQLENYQKVIEEMGFTVVEKAIVYIGTNLNVVIV